ncbi:MAG TPA: peptidoglycan-binding domain-containing protein, partial [Coleofasciculaceae cyanobacterium]
METFAYLHLAQDYEQPELKELAIFQAGSYGLEGWDSLRLSSWGAIALLTSLSSVWATSLAEVASAAVYYNTVAASQGVLIRPDGDRIVSVQPGCPVIPNPCGGFTPIYPDTNSPDYRPIRPLPDAVDPGYRPVRPTADVFLRRGDVGSDVRYVQDLLRSAGYFNATSTGFYATLTESGVKAFQRDQGL